MIVRIVELIKTIDLETLDQFSNRMGLTSIFTSVGLTAAEGLVYQPWALTDYALMISCVGGVLFIIEKLFVIYLRYKESKRVAKKDKQKHKSRKLP